ncbi:MAG TPA: hypothetical protein VGM11_06485 [Acidobacteriaceae bacterium]
MSADAGSTEFEQALTRAMRRVDVRAETAKKFLLLAEEAERQRVAKGGGLRLVSFSGGGGRVVAMPRPKAWMGGAIAAVLALGSFVGVRIHTEHERKVQAERQFEAAERITDETLARTREQLRERGIQLEP